MSCLTFLAALLALPWLPRDAAAAPLEEKATDALVRQALDRFGVPGCAVVVVRDGQVAYLRGTGVVRAGGPQAVSPDTAFAIASCSKAMTATAAAFLVQEGKLAWDDPLRKHLPRFRLGDPLAERDATLRDSLCHRSGLFGHDALRLAMPFDRPDEVLARLGELPLESPFRANYRYSNWMYHVAALTIGAADGTTYHEAMRSRLFEPLGMKTASTHLADLAKRTDAASPHGADEKGKLTVLPWEAVVAAPGSGTVVASARDLGRWLQFQLGQGRLDGKELLRADLLRETHTPQVVVRTTPAERLLHPEDAFGNAAYCLGWRSFVYRGKESLLAHGGALPGFRAHVVLAPKANVGIAVLANVGNANPVLGTQLPEALALTLLDRALDLPAFDWLGHHHKYQADETARRLERWRLDHPDLKPNPNRAALRNTAYAGTYAAPGYGTLVVKDNGDEGLLLEWGRVRIILKPFDGDTFRGTADEKDRPWGGLDDVRVPFRMSPTGWTATGLRFLDREFQRRPGP